MFLSSEIYIFWALQIFIIGLAGVLSTQNNVLFMLMSLEMSLLATNSLLILYSNFFNLAAGQVFSLFVLAVAAAEAAVGLSLFILYYKLHGTLAYPFINLVKG